jgi:sugar lactone lactonase YvrE
MLLAACGGGGGGSDTAASNDVLGSSGGATAPAPTGATVPGGAGGAPATGNVQQQAATTPADATQARFNRPAGLAMDGTGNLYVADSGNYTVRKITANGHVSTLAGSPGAQGSNDGVGAAARFSALSGIAVDGAGNIYVTDNSAIRKITPAGLVSTLAGAAGAVGDADGVGILARFNHPWGIAVTAGGTIYVADSGNYLIRAIDPIGIVTTFAGTRGMRGHADGSRASATFIGPMGIALDKTGNLYVTDWYGPPAPNIPESSTLVRKIGVDGSVSTLAGNFNGENGPARFRDTFAIATDSTANVYVAAQGNVQKITPAGAVSTFAGSSSNFQSLEGLAVDGADNLYVADRPSHALSRITPTGAINLYAGKPGEEGSADTAP